MGFIGTSGSILVLLGTLLAVFVQITPDPLSERLTTPTVNASDAVWSTGNSMKIHASADAVWKDLLTFKKYPEWSKSVKSIEWDTDELRVGSHGIMTAVLPGKPPNAFHVGLTSIDYDAKRISWKTKVNPEWLMDSERMQQVVDLPNEPGWCEYKSWDSWAGPLAYILKWTHKDWTGELRDDWMFNELKPYMERKR